MAWTRTAVSLAIVSAVLLRWAGVYGAGVYGAGVVVPVSLLWGVVVGIVLTQRRRYRNAVGGLVDNRAEPVVEAVLVLTVTVLLLGVGALVLVVIP